MTNPTDQSSCNGCEKFECEIDLVADLRMNHEYCPKEVILRAADELESLRVRVAELEECIKTRDFCIELSNTRSDLQNERIAELEADRAALVERVIDAAAITSEAASSDANKYDIADAIRAMDRNKILEGK